MRQVRDVLQFEDGRGGNERDRPPGGRGVVDGPADIEAACRRRARLAVAARDGFDTALEEQLFTAVGKKQGHRRLAEPDWAAVARSGIFGAGQYSRVGRHP